MSDKTYRAKQHDRIRRKQKDNDDTVHQPQEKIGQIQKVLKGENGLKILELFAGKGNLSAIYQQYGKVDAYDKKLKTGDSYLEYHRLIAEGKIYDVVDLDPYGFPNRFFPDVFLLMEDAYLFVTMPKPFVNVLNGITQQHLTCYYGMGNPTLEVIVKKIRLYGLCHWREVKLIDELDMGRLCRLVFSVKVVKATEYCGVKNRPDKKDIEKIKNKPVQQLMFE